MSFAKMIAVPCLLFELFFSHEHIGSGHNVYLVISLYCLSLTLGNGIWLSYSPTFWCQS